MAGKNKNKIQPPTKTVTDSEFDVKKNLQKLRTGKYVKSSVATVDDMVTAQSKGVSSTQEENRFQTGDFSQITDSFHTKYDKLKDDFGSLKDTVSNQITDVNKNFLQKSDFYIQVGFIVICFVTAATIIYHISYKDLIDDAETIKNKNQELLQKIEEMDSINKEALRQSNRVNSDVKKIDRRIDSIGIQLKKIKTR